MAGVQAVVGEAAAMGVEEIVTLLQSVEKTTERGRICVAGRFETVYPGAKLALSLYRVSVVRPEGGIDPEGTFRCRDFPVSGKIVARIIRGTKRAHAEFL